MQKENLEGDRETTKIVYLGAKGVGIGKTEEKNGNETLSTTFCLFGDF